MIAIIFFGLIQQIFSHYINENSNNGSSFDSFGSLKEFYSGNESVMASEEEILIFQSNVHCSDFFVNNKSITFK